MKMFLALAGTFVGLSSARNTLKDVYCEINNDGDLDWPGTGEHVVWFDVESGKDSDNHSGHYKMLISAEYIDAKHGDTVITDLWTEVRSDHHVYCPPGYDRVCNWDAEWATGTAGHSASYMVTLCAKKQTCTQGRVAVTGFISDSGYDRHTPQRITSSSGDYNRFLEMDVDGGGAWSAYEGTVGHYNTAFYQQKNVCTTVGPPPSASNANAYCNGRSDSSAVSTENCTLWAAGNHCTNPNSIGFMSEYCSATCCSHLSG